MNSVYISYEGRKYRYLKINFSYKNRIKDIIAVIMNLNLPFNEVDAGNWEFVVLELMTNALRASVEKNSEEKITLHIKIQDTFLITQVIDGAGGFNFKSLPYDISLPVEEIDLFAPEFEEYRNKYQFERFGIGLYSAKKFADEFDIQLIDKEGDFTTEYQKGKISGTFVFIKKSM